MIRYILPGRFISVQTVPLVGLLRQNDRSFCNRSMRSWSRYSLIMELSFINIILCIVTPPKFILIWVLKFDQKNINLWSPHILKKHTSYYIWTRSHASITKWTIECVFEAKEPHYIIRYSFKDLVIVLSIVLCFYFW